MDDGQTVGWLGLGAMGTPMAVRQAAVGRVVVAFDPGAPAPAGVELVSSPAAVAQVADVLVLMVATPGQAESALFGADGAAGELRPPARVVVLSTLGPAWVRDLADRLPAGVVVVDAPVSGGVVRAAAGTLLIMAAGVSGRDREFLAVLGEVVDVGDRPGQGQSMKMVNQVLCGVHIAAAAEALAVAQALGIEPGFALDTIRRGAGASFMLDDRGPRMVAGPDGQVRSAMSLFVKDLQLVLDEAGAAHLPTPVVQAALGQFAAAAAAGLGGHDDAELFDHVRPGGAGGRGGTL
ncbi:NAD(P)-dependent oxidoreductase (plasmid) [Rhodococcus antarcticus]|uniref:NAD(P)-dependent oxidoreductase n=1 Tax=Rhodococcus antarcticus TaxID=2987751 RepID=A0ABY6P5B9_9NOCA|nr:NAD(P)-dependent oxidoreductase [Rhodococcus antarcticus]UZJ26859.1 NAD(P)-dependent oxidoreductase [Rhodococcus antarcticus]